MYGTFTGSFSSTSPFKNQKVQIKVEKKKNTDKYSKDEYVYSVTFKMGLNLDNEKHMQVQTYLFQIILYHLSVVDIQSQ